MEFRVGDVVEESDARALQAETHYGEAAAVMQAAAVKPPEDEEVLGEYGKVLADVGERAGAAQDRPRRRGVSAQGPVVDRTGDHETAMQFYREALKVAPDEPAAKITATIAGAGKDSGDVLRIRDRG
jgi:Flp pilus assembly protein TadD